MITASVRGWAVISVFIDKPMTQRNSKHFATTDLFATALLASPDEEPRVCSSESEWRTRPDDNGHSNQWEICVELAA
jgi:hypothetical protein